MGELLSTARLLAATDRLVGIAHTRVRVTTLSRAAAAAEAELALPIFRPACLGVRVQFLVTAARGNGVDAAGFGSLFSDAAGGEQERRW